MTEEELDAAVDVIAAVDAGVLQSLNQRIKARNNSYDKSSERGDPMIRRECLKRAGVLSARSDSCAHYGSPSGAAEIPRQLPC